MTAWSTKAPRSRSIAASALGEHGGQAAGLLAERLDAHERVAEVVAARVAELGLGGQHVGVELGRACGAGARPRWPARPGRAPPSLEAACAAW